MAKQLIEGSDLRIQVDFKGAGGKADCYADKIEFEGHELLFYSKGKVVIRIPVKKPYDTIYEALRQVGVFVADY